MKYISLTIVALYLGIVASFAQVINKDSVPYEKRKLKFEQADLVNSYYHQDGNNSAVTGGLGTEKLTDFSNTFDLRLSRYGKTGLKHTYNFELGVDTYTSASSANIEISATSGPSYSDIRVYPSLSWDIANEQKGRSFGFDVSASGEFDYTSFGGGLHYSKSSKNKNTDVDIKLKAFFDTWKVILPYELRPDNNSGPGYQQNDRAPRNSFSGSFSLSQIFTKNFQAMLMIEPAFQQGLLATRYQRVYFTSNAELAEFLPDNRLKLPIGARLNYFLGDNLVFRSFFRYYSDNWGIKSETAELETSIKLNPFSSISPFYRYYQQTSADYFAAYGQHKINEEFYTSDYDLSKFHSNFYGAGIRFAPPTGVLGINKLKMIELRYGHYNRSNGLNSNIVSMNLRF
ncbi:hypothetical protein A5893_12680 [Pedobacter psychrophilus]|uniref:DUF3570 domain-containing protein n=1 Tax=Pedobacter psychrophilus TaxID=1826909 RepID=A0A179DEG2_9SPHI|nr:DUF3570 domain-containing protein [Pedobacter psychrophilus]OAQ38889.1 hypothetical protein A5893_12680 [Pedobacter psychrophilus]